MIIRVVNLVIKILIKKYLILRRKGEVVLIRNRKILNRIRMFKRIRNRILDSINRSIIIMIIMSN